MLSLIYCTRTSVRTLNFSFFREINLGPLSGGWGQNGALSIVIDCFHAVKNGCTVYYVGQDLFELSYASAG